ncbi:MAG: PEP-CTERM sorting domain-containing protein [Phycisphaerae bacterium]|nr:PEP-CTERM sorting domain-containing protein [Phycisphaerae bacterium]MDD5380639.1 PEP-CTERM sorting domain-containing protein [Phycisphaerae bacterium]
MNKYVAAVIVVISFLACTVSYGSPVVVLDQSQETYAGATGVYATNIPMQTFTPGISGNLDHVDLRLGSAYPTVIPATVSIVEVTIEGDPVINSLGSVTIPDIGMYGGWTTFDFASQSISLTQGTLYGLYVEADDPDYHSPNISWYFQNTTNPYPSGGLWLLQDPGGWRLFNLSTDNADACFRTYMTPEPTTIALLAVGLFFIRKTRN